jgi:hypothetical protein
MESLPPVEDCPFDVGPFTPRGPVTPEGGDLYSAAGDDAYSNFSPGKSVDNDEEGCFIDVYPPPASPLFGAKHVTVSMPPTRPFTLDDYDQSNDKDTSTDFRGLFIIAILVVVLLTLLLLLFLL